MAQFLTVALRAAMIIPKKRIQMDNIPIALAKSSIEENFNLEVYDYEETQHNLIWKLKETVLNNEITPFFNTLFKFYYQKEEIEFQSFIKEVSRVKTYEGLLKAAKEEVFDNFVLDDTQYWQIHLKKQARHLKLNYNMIRLFETERMRMDNFDATMQFLENTMQKAFSEFILSQALILYVFETSKR